MAVARASRAFRRHRPLVFILAYRLADVSSISPFLYRQLLVMVALGYFVFGDVPDRWTLLGSGIVVISSIYFILTDRPVSRRTSCS